MRSDLSDKLRSVINRSFNLGADRKRLHREISDFIDDNFGKDQHSDNKTIEDLLIDIRKYGSIELWKQSIIKQAYKSVKIHLKNEGNKTW